MSSKARWTLLVGLLAAVGCGGNAAKGGSSSSTGHTAAGTTAGNTSGTSASGSGSTSASNGSTSGSNASTSASSGGSTTSSTSSGSTGTNASSGSTSASASSGSTGNGSSGSTATNGSSGSTTGGSSSSTGASNGSSSSGSGSGSTTTGGSSGSTSASNGSSSSGSGAGSSGSTGTSASGSGSTSATTTSGSGSGSTTATTATTTSSSGSGSTGVTTSSGSGSGSTGTTSTTASTSGSGSGSGSTGTTSTTTSSGSGGSTGSLAYCAGQGAPVSVGDSAVDAGVAIDCAGNLAARTFHYALCTCQDLVVGGGLTTESYVVFDDGGFIDPAPNNSTGKHHNGAVGVNRVLNACGGSSSNLFGCGSAVQFNIGGQVHVGDGGLLTKSAAISRGVFSGANVLLQSTTVGETYYPDGGGVRGNTFCSGDVTGSSSTIHGDLYTQTLTGTGVAVDGLKVFDAGIVLPPPCDCSNPLDIDALVAAHMSDNDNAQAYPDGGGISPDLFATASEPASFTWPCGRYYLSGVAVLNGHTTWTISGRTAIFVDANGIANQSGNEFDIVLQPGAELDLFVAGNVTFGAKVVLGSSPATVSDLRWYIAGNLAINTPTTSQPIYGNFYVPYGTVTSSNPVNMYGSIFANQVSNGNGLTIYFDENVLSAGAECPPPPPPPAPDAGTVDGGTTTPDAGPSGCTSCLDCNNQACIGGTCGACATDADCCAPLICSRGTCIVP